LTIFLLFVNVLEYLEGLESKFPFIITFFHCSVEEVLLEMGMVIRQELGEAAILPHTLIMGVLAGEV